MLLVTLQPLKQEHEEAPDEITLAMGYVKSLVEHRCEHTTEEFIGLRHVLGSEDDPADNCEKEGDGQLAEFANRGQQTPLSHNILRLSVDAQQDVDGDEACMVEPPADEGPIGPMP